MNNRSIKFRAYDTKNKKWLAAVPSIEYLLDDDDGCISHHDIDEESAIFTYPHNLLGNDFNGRVVWQQYTGLKDKNNKEIYEGDIVEASHIDYKFGPEYTRCLENCSGLIKWYHSYWAIGEYKLFIMEDDSLNVIGNVFETPELLK